MHTPKPVEGVFRLDDSAEFLNDSGIGSFEGDSLIRVEKPSFLPSINNSRVMSVRNDGQTSPREVHQVIH